MRRNNIRGPHSALTDFLAANNISARQIRDDYARRLREAQQNGEQDGQANGHDETNGVNDEEIDDEDEEEQEEIEARIRVARRRQEEQAARDRRSAKNHKNKKPKAKGKATKKKKKGSDDDDDDDDDDDSDNQGSDFEFDGYKKAKKLPGQFDNCEICSKRFTVTPYSKTGPDNGLLCTPCGKQYAQNDKLGSKRKANAARKPVKRARQSQSERLDGVVRKGSKSLLQLCMESILKYHKDIESFGNMPESLTSKISKLFTKERIMTSEMFPLFVRRDSDRVIVYDCANLKTEDYDQVCVVPGMLKTLVLHNAYQFKNQNIDHLIEKAKFLTHLTIYAANLVSSEKWSELLMSIGLNLKTLKLSWLDAAFEDQQLIDLVKYCPSLTRLKLEYFWKINHSTYKEIAKLKKLQHLSLTIRNGNEFPCDVLVKIIKSIGKTLETLSLKEFVDLDDTVIDAIHSNCRNLKKLRINNSLLATDKGFEKLFSEWKNRPLEYIDLAGCCDKDMINPDGNEDELVGLGAGGFTALMKHSGSKLRNLDMTSCRHIPLAVLLDIFATGTIQYPELTRVNLSFVQYVDEVVLAGLFRAAGNRLKRVELFGCFGVNPGIVIPSGVVVIGAPKLEVEEAGVEAYGETLGGDAMDIDENGEEARKQLLEDIMMT